VTSRTQDLAEFMALNVSAEFPNKRTVAFERYSAL